MDKLDIADKIVGISMALSAMQYMFHEITGSSKDSQAQNALIYFLARAFDDEIKDLDNLSETLSAEFKTEHPGREKECGLCHRIYHDTLPARYRQNDCNPGQYGIHQ